MKKPVEDICSLETACLLVLAFLIGSTACARAYIDPGAGSMLIQLVTGGVAGALVVVRLYWRRLKSKIRGNSPAPSHDASWVPPKHHL